MMPFSGYMDSNPHLRNQPPYPHHYFPGFETVRPHFKADPSQSSMMYESWPCSSNCSRYPVPYHGCCSHGNFPGYYSYRPPCPHFAPSPAFHHYPNYPTFTEPYPAYCAHPPYYSNEQPRYEYDKDPHTNYHCCGCPNHVHNQKNDRGLKIEEQENDAEKKEGDLVVPIQSRSFPYPIMWIPPESMNSKERGKHNNRIELSDSNKAPCIEKPPKSSKPTDQQPKVWNGWFPLDMNGWQSLTQGEGEKQSQNQQKQDKMMQLPFPFFWVPNSDRKQEADENRDKGSMTTASDNSKQAPITLEYVPVEPSVSGVKIDKPQSDIEGSQNKNAAETKGKAPSQKCVPVEVKEGKSEGTEKRGIGVKDVSVKRAGDASKDGLGTIAKTKSPSPPKTSKLPPVCLRVDPLTKKKNGNGSSRSPSPPKGQSKDTLTKASTTPGKKEDSAVNTQNISGSLDNVEPGEKKIKYIPVVEERLKENKAGETTDADQAQVSGSLSIKSKEVSGQPMMEKSKKDSHESKTEEETKASFEEVMGAEKETGSDKAANTDELAHGQCKAETKTMSDDEAAKLIQSAFRGFEVRKWEPLKKLKQLADVREQLNEVRSRVQSLESSSVCDKDDKLRLLIGEKIMTLLLRLDTIQGYHSSVRDARKSLVKELVTLQEKLDALASKWAEEKIKDVATSESADSSDRASGNVGMDASAAFEDTNENSNNVKEPDQECSKHTEDGKDGKDEESTELPGAEQGLDAKIESNTVEFNIEHHTALGIEEKDMSPSLEHMTHISVPEQKIETDELVEVNDLSKEENPEVVEVNDTIPVEINSEDDKLSSLPTVDHEVAVCGPEKEIGDNNTETESDLPVNLSLPDEVEDLECSHTDQEIDLLKELPVGVIDEEPPISKRDEHSTEAVSNYSPKDQKKDEFTTSGEPPEVEMEQKVNKFEPEEAHSTTGEGNEPVEVHSTLDEENNEDDSGAIPADYTASSESEAGSESTQEKEVLFEEKKPVRSEEKEETKPGREIDMLQYDAPSESNANHGEDNKLMEENKKLKEIMEKVMEAGKDQVSVISKLAERVKELEEKLAKNKKSSMRGYRKVRYAPSYKYNKPLKSRAAAEVAI
ncbi:BCL-2-associated athanogene 6, ARABIDOPSIS THALIANA BCL-2-ASSOCIATED ATHANOGENE 6 [Hibiscus trionum]|uniref:BCL-2-associated athanogene 6, ARABIDOPSIS THALIANA BCL-2-ASSOCIATED ATHANOGENE 6 n=1 Tax=Hibiscus trionum TaxID=183268 RepID=A0A9W7HWV3_HIBTR|nr:BCL-2-associated athanogene 6, ARABIDOPSIS THALIANA BCL-2-ASSOCIATED ATHANOGENE 6 [Hibiscus trionum]